MNDIDNSLSLKDLLRFKLGQRVWTENKPVVVGEYFNFNK